MLHFFLKMLKIISLRRLKYFPFKIFQHSAKQSNRVCVLFSATLVKSCRSFSVDSNLDTFDAIDMEKFLKYIIKRGYSIGYQPEDIEKLVELFEKKKNLEEEIKSLEGMKSEGDKELEQLINFEKKECLKSVEDVKNEILLCLTEKKNDNENRDVELKIIPGIGGEEAKFFSEELFKMYLNYAVFKNWDYSINSENNYVKVSGDYVFGHLKYEAGVHRVQRVPGNDNLKRIQSSTCSVIVLPQPRVNEIQIHDRDLVIERIKSSGPGGQNVNKRETCVRVKHLPTGVVVENQTSRYQFENLKEAMNRLKSILFTMQQEKIMEERSIARKEQAGTNDYADKIRTYNFPQSRVTDHRINYSTQNLKGFLSGNTELDNVITQVREYNRKKELIENLNSILNSEDFKKFESQKAR